MIMADDNYTFKPPVDILETEDIVLTEQLIALANVFGIKAICVTTEEEKLSLKLNEVGIDYVNDCFYIFNPNTEKVETRASFADILTPISGGGGGSSSGGIQIDDNIISMYKTWSSRKIDAMDSALRTTIDAFSIIVNNVASDLIKISGKTDAHAKGSFSTYAGMHGFRFYNNALQYFYNDKWYNIPSSGGGTGGGATIDDNAINPNQTWSSEKINTENNATKATINGHMAIKILSPEGIHGIRLNNNKLQYFSNETSTWIDIPTSGDVIDNTTISTVKAWSSKKSQDEDKIIHDLITTHGTGKVMTEDGMHGIRYINGTLQCYNGTRWVTIPIVGATIDDTAITTDKVWSSNRVNTLVSDLNTTLTTHISKLILSENGLHGIRYYNGYLGVFKDNAWTDLKNAVIDDNVSSTATVWSSSKTKAEDDSIRNALGNVGTASTDHIASQLTTNTGIHGIRYYNAKLQYLSDGTWHDITGGGGSGTVEIDDAHISVNSVWSSDKTNTEISTVNATLTTHVSNAITSEKGLHNIRYFNDKLSVFNGTAWVDIKISDPLVIDDTTSSKVKVWSSSKTKAEDDAIRGTVTTLDGKVVSHTAANIASEAGSHGFRYLNNKLQYFNGTAWVDVAVGVNIIDDTKVAVDKVWSSIKTKVEFDGVKTAVTTVDGKVTSVITHVDNQLFSAAGIHGMRYFDNKLQYYNGTIWANIMSGAVIDDSTASVDKVWSSSKTKAEDDEVRAISTDHISKQLLTEAGIHGLRYFENKLQYFNGTVWVNMSTSGGVVIDDNVATTSTVWSSSKTKTEVDSNRNYTAMHIANKLYTETGIHGMRYFENKLQYFDGTNWVDITTGGSGGAVIDDTTTSTTKVWSSSKTSNAVTSHTVQKILSVDGLHGIRYHNAILAVHDGTNWVDLPSVPGAVIDDPNILTTKTWSSSKIASEDAAVKKKVTDFDEILTTHVTTQVNTDVGMHGFRFFENDLQYFNPDTKVWVRIPTGGTQIDDTQAVNFKAWSSLKTKTEDDAIKTALTATTTKVDSHVGEKINTADGSHGMRYDGGKLQYNDGTWKDIPVGAAINDTTPSATTVYSGTKVNTHITDTAAHIGTTTKATPIDADALIIADSADTFKTKRLTWAAIKTALTTAFTTVFAAIVHKHVWADITDRPTTTVSAATIAAASWTGTSAPYSYTYSNAAITTTNIVEFTAPASISADKLSAILRANIHGGTQSAGSIVMLAYDEKPTIAIDAVFIIRN